jgi:hypothetical protein
MGRADEKIAGRVNLNVVEPQSGIKPSAPQLTSHAAVRPVDFVVENRHSLVAFGEDNRTHWSGKPLRVELSTRQRVRVEFLAHNVDEIQGGFTFRK